MAWQSSGTNNEEMVDNMKRFGVIHSDAVVEAFRAVDRRYFVPNTSRAHVDEPIREGHIHISAPHIYGCIVEALHITPKSSTSFLNIGSGTGYLSSIVAHIVGPTGICYGIELDRQAYDHGVESVDRWKKENKHLELPLMEFIHGNGLSIDGGTGEAIHGFDRIYIGATIERSKMKELASLLRLGGIMVGPVDDELLQVTRIRKSDSTSSDLPRSFHGNSHKLSDDFSENVITGVRFASLVNGPPLPTVIQSRVWGPSLHKHYPETFRNSCKEILLCSQASAHQPPPFVPIIKKADQINVAAQLPKSLWLEVLSFCNRDWFEQPKSEAEILRQRLQHYEIVTARAEEARRDAEMRLQMMIRERDGYRRLALRTQVRLQSIINESATANEPEDMLTDDETSLVISRFSRTRVVSGMNAFIRQFQQDLSDDDQDDDLEDDQGSQEIRLETLDDASTSNSVDDDVSDGLESSSTNSDTLVPTRISTDTSSTESVMFRQSRTVSMSSDDMRISQI